MPAVTPQAAIHDLAAIGRVGLEVRQLPVGQGFKSQPGERQQRTQIIQVAQWRCSADGGKQRQHITPANTACSPNTMYRLFQAKPGELLRRMA